MNRKATIAKAALEIKSFKSGNGGITKYGLISTIVQKYQSIGYDYVTRGTLAHYFAQEKLDATKKPAMITVIPSTINITDASSNNEVSTVSDEFGIQVDENVHELNRRAGRPKGTTHQAQITISNKMSAAATMAAEKLAKAKGVAREQGKKIPDGLLKKILKETEDKFGLANGVLKQATIKQRVVRNNLTGIAKQRVSPISPVEPIIVDYCVRLANMGAPLFRDQIMSHANSIIVNTSFKDDFINFKIKRNLLDLNTSTGTCTSNSVVGVAWYRGFMKRNASKIASKKGRVKDVKRHTWCVFDTFEAMYKNVYDTMVESKVAEKVGIPLMYDISGNEVSCKESAYGLPTQYRITDPKNIIFVDETGKNTNMKEDKSVGGKRYVVPVDSIGNSCGYLGSTTDIHFTVLCFTCATGEPVMCAIILKSEKT